jgi:hypothetical protein
MANMNLHSGTQLAASQAKRWFSVEIQADRLPGGPAR